MDGQSKNPTQMEIQASLPTAIYENQKQNGQQAYNDMHDNVIIAIWQHFRDLSIYLPIYLYNDLLPDHILW